jgi:enoyl-[acyl-carrier protein] reductase I
MFRPATAQGKKALVTGIANDQSIAWAAPRPFGPSAQNSPILISMKKAKPYVEPLAREVGAEIFMPLNVQVEGQLEAVFDAVGHQWGKLDIGLHSIAFAPKEDLQGRVVDCSKAGFLSAMDVSCWSFIRMAKLAEPLMKDGGTLSTMTYYGSQMVVEHYNIMGPVKAALESATRYLAAELGPKGIRVHAISPGPLKTRAASGITDFDELIAKAEAKAPTQALCRLTMSVAASPFST